MAATNQRRGWTEPARPGDAVAHEDGGAQAWPRRAGLIVACALATLGCGPVADGGRDPGDDPGANTGVVLDAGVVPDGDLQVVTLAGAPRLVFGTMTVNGTPYELSAGFATRSLLSHFIYLGTADDVSPRLQVTLMVPGDAEPGFEARCGGPRPILLAARWILPDKVAFFTRNPTCTVALTEVATAVGEEYRGTFSATLDFEPRSALDPGFPVMTITDGSFTVRRPF